MEGKCGKFIKLGDNIRKELIHINLCCCERSILKILNFSFNSE